MPDTQTSPKKSGGTASIATSPASAAILSALASGYAGYKRGTNAVAAAPHEWAVFKNPKTPARLNAAGAAVIGAVGGAFLAKGLRALYARGLSERSGDVSSLSKSEMKSILKIRESKND